MYCRTILNIILKVPPETNMTYNAVVLYSRSMNIILMAIYSGWINPYPTAFPYGNGMVLHFYQQQKSSTTKTVHKVINKRLKTYV
jgi:hypothetical protein